MQKVSYFGPLDTAFGGTKRKLFSPFDMGKWFALGFSAWLATLGEQGGSIQFPTSLGDKDMSHIGAEIADVIHTYLPLIITVGVLAITLICVFSWLNARGKFMFLDNVIADRALVAQPWEQFRDQGNSLFCWMLVFGLTLLMLVLLLIGAGLVAAWPSIVLGVFDPRAVASVVVISILFLVLAIAAAYIQVFVIDFVVPLMWKYRFGATDGWRHFAALFRDHRGTFLLYGVMRLLIGIGAGTAVAMAGFLTCCCGFLLLMIPYVNAVCLLPITVFKRLYSIEFLKQFGPEYDVTATSAEPPPVPGAVMP